jgi:hypothetical protein
LQDRFLLALSLIEETEVPHLISLANGFSPMKRFSSRAKPVYSIHQVVGVIGLILLGWY